MSFVNAGDIVKLGQIAYKLWELAFSKAKNAEKQYADFGADIQHFARNLEKLGKVIRDVTKQVPASLSGQDHAWDLKSLLQICGDFRKTLSDCQRLLQDESKFGKGRGGFIYNIQWNLSVEPEVTRLKDRVAFHNIKISTILKPLELKLLLDLKNDIYNVHGDLASRITELHEILRRIEGHWTKNADETSAEVVDAAPEVPRAPDYLEVKFETAIRATNSELQEDARFPLAKGINAFHHHFEQSTSKFQPEISSMPGDYFAERTPEPAQYLNLMKSIWIIQKVKRGEEYVQASSDRLWDCYIKELDEKCQREFRRFTTKEPPGKRLKEPDRRCLELLREEEFRIWLEDDEDNTEFQPGTDYLKEILHVLLSSSARNRKQELVLLRQSDMKLEMQSLSSKTTGPPNREILITDVNLRRTHLVPLYASPMATPEALNIVFKGDGSAERSTSLSFLKLKDLLDFQQAITGYQTVYDETDIKVLIYASTGLFSRGKQTAERGRVQIWTPKRLERPQPNNSQNADFLKHRQSVATGSTATSTAPSVARSTAKSFATSFTSPITTENATGFSFEMPGLPMLVFYLKADIADKEEVSYMSIEMDKKTIIKDFSCSCGRNRASCIHSTIERSGDITARRVEAEQPDEELNLANLGTYQKSTAPVLVKKMKYIHIDFKTWEDRIRFDKCFTQTKKIYNEKLYWYWEEQRLQKQEHSGD